jgi:hypothetical protein
VLVESYVFEYRGGGVAGLRRACRGALGRGEGAVRADRRSRGEDYAEERARKGDRCEATCAC